MPQNISALLCTEEISTYVPKKYGVIVCESPRVTFFKLHNLLSNNKLYIRYENDTIIGKNVKISDKAIISDRNVKIGNNVIIEEFVVVRENTIIGDNCIIRAGTIIGGEGFEFKRVGNERIEPVKHLGGVVINDNVEIQYHTCIDKAVYPWDNTIIDKYTKIDNLVHIGHAAKIGQRCLLAANSLVGGRTIIGNDSWVGISATISNGLKIGENVSVNLGAVVTRNVEDGISVSGNFAIEHNKYINFIKTIR